jgi:ABC-type uncharacterized transport system permease subunit
MRILKIVRSHIKSVWRQDLAHFADSSVRILSSISFSLSFLFSLRLLLARTKEIAGYSPNQILFLVLLSQIVYFLLDSTIVQSIVQFQFDAHKGTLDYALIRPIGVRTYLMIRNISVLSLIKGVPIILIYALPIKWTLLPFTLSQVLGGLLILSLIFASISLLMLSWATKTILIPSPKNALMTQFYVLAGAGREMPNTVFKSVQGYAFAAAVPLVGAVTFSGAVMLGKMSFVSGLLVATFALSTNLIVCNYFWRLAMLKYNSASS